MGISKKELIMNEQLVQWKPIKGLSKKYYVESISDSTEGFKIILFDSSDRRKKVHVIFEDSVESYKSTDESLKWRDLHELHKQYGRNFITEWTFFKVINSNYVKLLSDQTYGTLKPEYLTHFILLAVDSVVDIINPIEPKVEIMTEE